MGSFKKFVDEHYPELSERERQLIAEALYSWFYGRKKV
jgi:hypothetical protein